MKKYLILAAFAAVALGACTKVETSKITVDEPISFGVYAGKAATKAVSATDFGTVTTNSLGASAKGFGVFAYYTDDATYGSSTIANFMYNQKVTGNGTGSAPATAWTYSPVKYWPNEHGDKAISDAVDKLTFLAYAPYVENLQINTDNGVAIKDNAATPAAASEGIIAMTANNVAGDATLTFKVPASSEEQIDLLYGVMGATYVDVQGNTIGVVGNPLVNLTKQATNGNVNILFKHALAKIAIDIKDVIDQVAPESSINPTTTKVVVKSVKLKGTDIGTQGDLNLYTRTWSNLTTATEFAVAPLPTDISVTAAPTEYPTTIAGVDEDGLDKTIDLMLIPATATSKITGVEIVYYVCTQDLQLASKVSVVENKISKILDTDSSTDGNQPLTIEMGKQYGLNLLLGLTSIDLTATVGAWDDTTPATDVDLPQNVTPAP